MERSFSVAQVTGAIPGGNPTPPDLVKLTKPAPNQSVIIGLVGTAQIDLSSIANTPVTFVHVGDRLVILFDNQATVTLEPFFNSDGAPLSTISVELAPDRSVTGAEFASLFPITQDQSVLPTAGNSPPSSGADFETVTIDQLLGTPTALALLSSDSPNGSNPGPNDTNNIAINTLVAPTLTVHAAGGSEDKPIALSITDALGVANSSTSLGNVTISGIPAGVTFNQGTLSSDGKTLTLTPAQLAGLMLASDGEAQHFNLTVTATTVDGGASTTATLHVDVAPVADTPTLAVTSAAANEDHAIALNIQSALGAADADAVLTVTISGIPAGVTFNQGTLSPDGKTLTLTPAQLAGLTLTGDGEVQHLDLTVTATAVDGGDTATAASVSKTLHVDVTPVADAPVLIASAAASSVNEDGTVALNIATQAEGDGDAVTTVTISGLGTATLSAGHVNPDGSVTLQQSDLKGLTLHAADDDTASLHLTVTASTNDSGSIATSSAQTIDLAVNPVADAPILDLPRNPSPLDVPNAFAFGINNSDTIVGEFVDQSGNTHGFVDQGGAPVTLNVPNSTFTAAFSINAAGDVAGFFDDQSGNEHGFVDHARTFTQIDFTDSKGNVAPLTDVLGIDDSGEVVGQFIDSNNHLHSFSEQGGVFTQIDVPGAKATGAFGVNDAGEIVGFFNDAAGNRHGFLEDTNGAVTVIDVPGATLTQARGIDNNGDIVGVFDDAIGRHGFLRDPSGHFTTIDVSGSTETEAFGVNDAREVVGVFADREGPLHGFVAGGVSGTEDNPIALGIKAALGEVDPDAVLSVTISGLPSGVTLSDANNDPLTIGSNGSIALTPDQLTGLALTSNGEVQHFTLTVTATTVDGGDTATKASTTQLLHVDVTPVADKPTLMVTDASGTEDRPIALDIQPASADPADQDTVIASVTIAGAPAGAMLNHGTIIANVSGVTTWSVDPADVSSLTLTSDGEVQQIQLTVTATAVDGGNTATAAVSDPKTLTVDVTPVADKPTLTVTGASGSEDHAIALNIQPALAEADADAALTVMITGLPSGVTLSNTNGDTLTISQSGSITLTAAQLSGLTLTSDGETQRFDLAVTATTVDGGNTATAASTTATLHVDVTPVADAPLLNVINVSGNEDHAIALNIAALGEADADAALTVAITGLPTGVTLSDANGDPLKISDGSITLTGAQLAGLALTSDGETQHFDLSVTATTVDGGDTATAASTTATLHVDVTPVADLLLTLPTVTTTFDLPPGENIFNPGGINDTGTTVGSFQDSGGHVHGFVLAAGAATPTVIDLSTNETDVFGINDAGTVVGRFAAGGAFHGFVQNPGAAASQIDVPGSISTELFGINASGEIVGDFTDATTGLTHGLIDIGGSFTSIDMGNGVLTEVQGVDNAGDIVGFFEGSDHKTHGFLLSAGAKTPTVIDVPGALVTEAIGIDSAGEVVGFFQNQGGSPHAFVDRGGIFNIVNPAGAVFAEPTGVSSAGQLDGFFIDATGGHDFEEVNEVSGNEDTPINLGINAALGEVDADAALTVTIAGLPSGVTLSNTNGDPLTISNGSITLTPDQLAGLALTSDGEAQHFDLTVTANAVDGGNATTAAAILHVNVTPVADTPVLTLPAPVTTTFDLPGKTIISADGINNAGTIVGTFQDNANHLHGFVLAAGTVTQVDVAGAIETEVNGIGPGGAIVGTFLNPDGSSHGFVKFPAGTVTTIDPAGSLSTQAFGINGSGEIVGAFTDAQGRHGFVDNNGTFTTINVPGAQLTEVRGVDAVGDIVGRFEDSSGTNHGFLLQAGATTPTTIDVPGAAETEAMGINDAGDIVGFFDDQQGQRHAFVDQGGTFITVDPPGATAGAQALGINQQGQLVGVFENGTVKHGFEVTLPEVTGVVGAPTALNTSVDFGEVDADAASTLTISGIPTGVTFSAGTLSPDGASLTLTAAELAGLTLTGNGRVHNFDLTVTATTVDGGDQATATSVKEVLHVNLISGGDVSPALFATAAAGSVNEDGTVALDIVAAPPDATVTVKGLGTATLNHGTVNKDGSVTLQQSNLTGLTLHAADDDTSAIQLTVTATTDNGGTLVTTAPQTINLAVNPVPEAPTLTASASASNVLTGGSVALNIAPTFETDPDAVNTITIMGLNGATLSAGKVNQDGSVTLTPAELAGLTLTEPDNTTTSNLTLQVTATASDAGTSASSSTATINLSVATSVNEGGTVALDILAPPPDATVTVSGLGTATLNHGTVNKDGSVTLQQSDLADLTLHAADDDTSAIHLTVTATTNNGGTPVTTALQTVNLIVNPVAEAPTLAVSNASGSEDHAIALNIQPALSEADADAALTVTITGLPTLGVTLSNADGKLTIDSNGSITLTPDQLVGLALTSDGDAPAQHFTLTVTATTVDGGNTATAAVSDPKTLTVDVAPVANAPALAVSTFSGDEDTAIALPIKATLSEVDPDAVLTVTISGIPTGATLSDNGSLLTVADGSVTLTGSQITDLNNGLVTLTSDGETLHFDLKVTATTVDGGDTATAASATVMLHVDVTPVADPPTLIVGAPGPTTFFFPDQSNQQGAFLNQAAINDAGTIVGTVEQGISIRGFELTAGATTGTLLNFAQFIDALGINSSGTIVGDFTNGSGDKNHGFVLSPEGALTTVDFTGSNTVGTSVAAINDLGVIAGNAFVNGAGHVGFVDRGGVFTTINIEGLGTTQITGIDNAGDIVGSFSTDLTHVHGFILAAGQTTPTIIDVPFASATVTEITGINNSGVVVGFFDAAGVQHGFVDNNGTFVTLDLPGGSATPTGINDNGQVVGTFGKVGFETTIPGIGLDGQPIALGIQAVLSEADPNAVLTVRIAGVPVGASLNHGSIVSTDANGNTTWVVNSADLPTLTLTSDSEVQHFNLIVTATAVDGGDAATAASVTSQPLHIDVTPVSQAPVFNVTNVSGNEDQAIALNNFVSVPQADPDETVTITITGIPAGVTFNTGTLSADGKTLTLTSDQLANLTLTSDGETEHFDLTVTATAQDGGAVPASTSSTLHVDVTPVPDVTVTVAKEVLAVPGGIVSIPASEALHELDADASLGPITISGFPANSGIRVLFGANQQFQVAPDATGTVTLSPDQLTNLALQMPATDLGSFTLHVAATASDGSVTETIHNDIQVLDLPNVQQLNIDTVAQGTQPAGQPQGPAGASVNAQIANISSDPQNPNFQFTFNSPADHGSGGSAIAGTDADPTDATASHFFISPTGDGLDSIIVEANSNNNFGLSGGDAGAVGPTGQNLPFDEVVSDVNHTVVIDPIAGVTQITDVKTIVVETPDGPNGGNGAAGGAGSHGTALLDQVIVDRGAGNNNGIFVQVLASGGNGGRAHPGGDGAPGEPDTTGTVTTDTSHSFDSGFSDITVTTELGSLRGLAGSGGDGGAGGAGGAAKAIIQNSSFTVSGNNSITIEDSAEGGSGGNGGNGGAGGAGIFSDGSRVSGFGGNGGDGGRGGDATAIVQNDTIAGTGDDNISVMVIAFGGSGGNGGNGGAGSDDHKTDINQVIVQTISQDGTVTIDPLHSSTQVITDTHIFGTGGHGGAGGGSNAFAELLNNDIHVDGSGNIAIQLEPFTPFGTSEIDMTGNSIHGGSGSGTISITARQFLNNSVFNFSNNDIETGAGTETIQLVVNNSHLAAVNGSGNHFVGNGANETLDLSGWDRAIDIDFGTGNIKLDAATGTVSGTVSGFANLIGTSHADSFENLSGNISVIGGNAADTFGLASNVIDSTIIPSIADFHPNNESIDISSVLNTVFGGNNPSNAGNFVQVKEDAGGTSATVMINQSGTAGGSFVAAAHLVGIHAGDVVTAVLDHAQHTAQLTAH